MQQDDDPFSLSADSSRTIIMPTPGGRRRGGAAAVIPPSSTMKFPSPAEATSPRPGDLQLTVSANPRVRAAGPLFTLLRQLRALRDHADVPTLRADVIEAIRQFQADTHEAGVDPKTSAQACYALVRAGRRGGPR